MLNKTIEHTMTKKSEDFVIIYKTHNRGLAALAKSLLDNYEIDYFVLNENSNDVIGSGIILGGFTDPAISPIEFLVSREDELRAKKIFENFEEK